MNTIDLAVKPIITPEDVRTTVEDLKVRELLQVSECDLYWAVLRAIAYGKCTDAVAIAKAALGER